MKLKAKGLRCFTTLKKELRGNLNARMLGIYETVGMKKGLVKNSAILGGVFFQAL